MHRLGTEFEQEGGQTQHEIRIAISRNAERLPLERLPTTLVVDRDGLIRHVHQGFGPGSAARLAAEVEALLGPAPVSSPVAPLPAVPPPAGPGRP